MNEWIFPPEFKEFLWSDKIWGFQVIPFKGHEIGMRHHCVITDISLEEAKELHQWLGNSIKWAELYAR